MRVIPKRVLRCLTSPSLALVLVAMLAAPVLAVSQISNGMTISPGSFACGVSVDVRTDTDFNQVAGFPTNPYSSDYAVAIAANHLRLPNIYYRVGENANFVYKSSEGSINNQPAYWYSSGLQWFLIPTHHYLYATFTPATRSSSPPAIFDTRKNWHGQADIFSSYGAPAVYYTTHTSSGC